MFVLANFFKALASILDIGLTVYMWMVIARAVVSWVNPDPYNPIIVFLRRSTDPVLLPIQRKFPFREMGIDFSPFIAILVLSFIFEIISQTINNLFYLL